MFSAGVESKCRAFQHYRYRFLIGLILCHIEELGDGFKCFYGLVGDVLEASFKLRHVLIRLNHPGNSWYVVVSRGQLRPVLFFLLNRVLLLLLSLGYVGFLFSLSDDDESSFLGLRGLHSSPLHFSWMWFSLLRYTLGYHDCPCWWRYHLPISILVDHFFLRSLVIFDPFVTGRYLSLPFLFVLFPV